MKILETSETLLTAAGLGIAPTVTIAGLPIPRRLVCISSMAICCLLQVPIFAKNHGRGLGDLLMPIHLALTYLTALLVYTSRALKATQLIELFEYLRDVIDQSEFSHFYHSSRKTRIG